MSSPFLGEIRMVGFNFAPAGWAMCNGQILPISQNSALFSLFGTTYGGDGVSTFGLPDFRGRQPFHQGPGFVIGQIAGTENETLITNQLPSHSHTLSATKTASSASAPVNNVLANTTSTTTPIYSPPGNPTPMANALTNTGGSLPHNNIQPFQVITFVVALEGIFPSRG